MNVYRAPAAERRRQDSRRRGQLLLAVVKLPGSVPVLVYARNAASPSAMPEVLVPITTPIRSAPKRLHRILYLGTYLRQRGQR